MKQPEISIIVPVYNTEKYLSTCIESILNQTFTNFELLLIDDGSTDNSGHICDEYAQKDNRIRVFHKTNEGVSTARNLGIDVANGEYLLFIDSDDYIENSMLKCMLYTNKKYNTQICVTWDGTTDKGYFTNQKINKDEAVKRLLSFKYPASLCTSLYKSDLLNDLRLSEDIHHWEDYEFQLRILLKSESIYILDKKFYNYIQRDGSANHVDINDKSITCLKIPNIIKQLVDSNNNLISLQNYYDAEAFFLSQTIFKLLMSKNVEAEYLQLIQDHCRKNFLNISKAKSINLKYKFLIYGCCINIRIVYYFWKYLHNKK